MFEDKIFKTNIPGLFLINAKKFEDGRGLFLKIFEFEFFQKLGLETNFMEDFFSISKKNVLRGLHFQIPPMDHVKVVYCSFGKIFDVVVDLRIGSPTYGKAETFELSPESGLVLYIPKGLAHGFLTLSEMAVVNYKVSTKHSPEHDKGILWNSVDIDWPVNEPILSQRDRNFPKLCEYKSPFIYKEETK
ncbi:MAG TPA: dTDP-4-dehydrorhamnose 3,5-epimerase [Fervidobacterium nodosum]|nr:dTDP-4-dehydrorhamnose 3,5-epimerase [Fervidobacterium nodosum]